MVDLKQGVAYDSDVVERYIKAGYWTEETPQHWLAALAEDRGDAPAVKAGDQVLSYGDLHDTALRFANGLLDLGFCKGEAIGIQMPNLPEFLIAYHGVQMMGGVLTLMHMPYRGGELIPLLNHGGVKGMICFAGIADYDAPGLMLSLKPSVPTLERVIVAGGEPPNGTVAFTDLAAAKSRPIADPPRAEDPAVLAFTSGTSDAPKAVIHDYRTLACSHRLLSERCGIGPDDTVLSAPPFTHIYGLNVANITLRRGAASGLMSMFTPPAFAAAIRDTRATIMFCGPAHALACMKAGLFGDEVLNSLKRVVFAGSACPPDLVIAMEKMAKNATVYQMWGMTEVLMEFINPLDAPLDVRLRSIGTPPDWHDIRAVVDGQTVAPGEEGEMEITGPMVFAGYYNNVAANARAFSPDGWFRTGDLVTIDEDRNVVMTGRVKDIINRGGIKINPVDIEGLIDEHPAVCISAIAPMPDEVLGEKACLFVELQPEATLTLADVQKFLADKNVAKMKWPERLEIVDEMPMTPTRKIIKGMLVERLAAD